MSIDISNLFLCNACVSHSIFHSLRSTGTVIRRGSNMISVTGTTVAHHFTVNLCTTAQRVLQLLKYYDTCTLAHYKTASVLIERNGASCRVFVGGQCSQSSKSGDTDGGNTALCTAGYHNLRLSMLNGAESLSDGIGSCGTCGYYVNALTLQPKLNGYITCCHIGNHQGNHQRINSGWTFFQKLSMLSFNRLQGTDAGAYGHTHTKRIFLFHIKTGILHSLFSCCHGILTEQLHTLCSLGVHVSLCIEVFYFCRKLAFVLACIKFGNGSETDFVCFDSFPEIFYT